MNFAESTHNLNASSNPVSPSVRKYLYIYGQNLWQTYFTLRKHLIYWLWTTQTGLLLCASYHPWQDSMLQVSASWYSPNKAGQILWFLKMDHATWQKLLQVWWESLGSITLQAPHTIYNPMDWQESLSKLSRICSTRKWRRPRPFEKSNDIPQYSLDKQFTISNADLAKQDCKIKFPHVKCCKKMIWFRLRAT